MVNLPISSPKVERGAYVCFHCGVHAQHYWFHLLDGSFAKKNNRNLSNANLFGQYIASCVRCGKVSFWKEHRMLYPESSGNPPQPLPKEAGEIANEYYMEAASISTRSPNAACAMLRTALDSMLRHIFNDHDSENLKALIKKYKHKFDDRILIPMDKLRVTGNDAIHPSLIETQDSTSPDDMLWLLGYVSRELITDPKKTEEICNKAQNEKPKEEPSGSGDREYSPPPAAFPPSGD